MMSERRVISLILGIAVFFTFAMPQGILAGDKTVTNDLKGTIDQVMVIVNDDKLKDDPQTRREILRQTINKRFNYDQMAVRALAKNWGPRTPEEREEFTRLFQRLLERTYAKKIESFDHGEVKYKDEVIKGKYAMVKTTVQQHGKSVNLDYKLTLENNEWKVYDFVIQGVSIVRNYRNQFSKALKKESFDDLIKKLEDSSDDNTI